MQPLAQQLTVARLRPRALNRAFITQAETRRQREEPKAASPLNHTTIHIVSSVSFPRSTPNL